METLTLLNSRFFLNIEEGIETDIKTHYKEIRSLIVSFSQGNSHWRNIHTGLTLFISEVKAITKDAIGEILHYGNRILDIAVGLLNQLELMVKSGNMNPTCKSADSETEVQEKPNPKKKLKLTANYTAVCEIINMIISMNMFNGGDVVKNDIIDRVHELFGLDYSTTKYYKTRGEIIRRCPADEVRTYFLKAAMDVLNSEYASA